MTHEEYNTGLGLVALHQAIGIFLKDIKSDVLLLDDDFSMPDRPRLNQIVKELFDATQKALNDITVELEGINNEQIKN